MARKREWSGGSGISRKRMASMFSLVIVLMLSATACGSSGKESIRSSGTLSSGEVILGDTGISPDASAAVRNPSGDFDPATAEPTAGSPESAQPSGDDGNAAGNPASAIAAEASPSAEPGASVEPDTQAEPPAGMQASPVPEASAIPDKNQANANAGIIVRSENILSTKEKEALLNELEKELNGLFGAIDQVSTEQQAGQAE
jgi:hypothetical protein